MAHVILQCISSSFQRINQINHSVLREARPNKIMPKQDLLLSGVFKVMQIMYMYSKPSKF